MSINEYLCNQNKPPCTIFFIYKSCKVISTYNFYMYMKYLIFKWNDLLPIYNRLTFLII